MAYKTEHVKDPEWMGHSNSPPRNLRPVSEDEIILNTKFGVFSPKLTGYRQVYLNDKDRSVRRLTPIHWSIYDDDSGIAYSVDYWAAYDRSQGKESERANQPGIQWYRFDGPCDHEYETKQLGNAWYEHTCKHCGYTYQVDSSG